MDDIRDPSGKDPRFDTAPPPSPPEPSPPGKEVGPESERRGGHEGEPQDEAAD